ncbi:hypothetical protein, partial [Streptomyces flavofungini]|uniref:hypothetical protein n=1 Tax=Streptomyces flavofungini TaxID=68200 RepID=UPI0034DFA006
PGAGTRTGSPGTPNPAPPLSQAGREILKATLVPLDIEQAEVGQALVKAAYARQLNARANELESVRSRLAAVAGAAGAAGATPPGPGHLIDLLQAADEAPHAEDLAAVPVGALRALGEELVAVRRSLLEEAESAGADGSVTGPERQALHSALVAVKGLAANAGSSRVGLMNLERLEMVPAGIERGELVATIPLAPLEETAVVQKEWSVQKKEFTSIVTDELETFSETGVTDNTELAQSTSSEQQHSNQFNVTGTVSGGIPVISGSATSGYTAQDSSSQSATDSRKHATTLTQKASARAKQEHKVTISTTTVTGSSQTSTRKLRNPSDVDPMRIDYFSLMRKWRVRLYRYGLRETYDIVVPEPGAALRRAYVELERLRAQLKPFAFDVPHNDVTDAVRKDDPEPPKTDPPTDKQPHYLVLADRYGAQGLPRPPAPLPPQPYAVDSGALPNGRASTRVTLKIPDGYEIVRVTIAGRMTSFSSTDFAGDDRAGDDRAGHGSAESDGPGSNSAVALMGALGQFTIVGTDLPFDSFGEKVFDPGTVLHKDTGGDFLAGATGSPVAVLVWDRVSTQTLVLTAEVRPTKAAYDQWRDEVWNGLFTAAQTRYYDQQQDIAGRIAALEERLGSVDTLTLRREENDEVMRAVLRYLLGDRFPTMPKDVVDTFEEAKVDITHGTSFDSDALTPDSTAWSTVRRYENLVRFVNQAIEWENVVSFLYSYFWDIPQSWAFIRDIKHPDANRQAFLRAGSARVVLTVRKGWETRWVNFVERGVVDDPAEPSPPALYWTIAQEIAAYDDRNYPGIPPANPSRTAVRIQDAVISKSSSVVGPSRTPVAIRVESSEGFVAGAQVVIDSARELTNSQELTTVTRVLSATQIEVARLAKAHNGASTPFPVLQPAEKGELMAEWNEYTPTSGTDIAVTSNLSTIN